MKTVALADVLWDAANRCLSTGIDGRYGDGGYEFSCSAVIRAFSDLSDDYAEEGIDRVMRFLARLGCPTGSLRCKFHARDFKTRQGNRYMWLLLAACVAEDEGITVEVA